MRRPNRKRPRLVATRVTVPEKALVVAAAADNGVTEAELLRAIILPAVADLVRGSSATPVLSGSTRR